MNHLLNVTAVISTYSFVKLPKANDEYNTSVFRANVGWFWNFGHACVGQFGQLCDKPQNTSSTLDGTHAPMFGKNSDSKKKEEWTPSKFRHFPSMEHLFVWKIFDMHDWLLGYFIAPYLVLIKQVQGAKKMLRHATVARRDLGKPTLQ